MLVRSFKHIYKIAGLGIAAGISGLMSLSLMQRDTQVAIEPRETAQVTSPQDEEFQSSAGESVKDTAELSQPELEPSTEILPDSPQDYVLEEALELQKRSIEAAEANPATGSGTAIFDVGDLAISLIVLAVIFGGFAAFFFFKSIKHSKRKQLV